MSDRDRRIRKALNSALFALDNLTECRDVQAEIVAANLAGEIIYAQEELEDALKHLTQEQEKDR